jgi:hypothetical protein
MLTLDVAATSLIYNHVPPLPPSLSGGQGTAANGVTAVGFIAGVATVGALLGWKRPANPIGWLLCASRLSYAVGSLGGLLLEFPGTCACRESRPWL